MTATTPKARGIEEVPLIVEQIDPELERRKRLPIGAWLAGGWMVLIMGAALLAPVLPLNDPNAEVASIPKLAPGQEGLIFGADGNGRDMFARLIFGARVSLTIAFTAVILALIIGGLLGLLAGYYRNWIGNVLASLFDIMLAIPALVLALALVAVLKGNPAENEGGLSGQVILIIAICIVSIPALARITRANTMAWSKREFVTAAKAQGATSGRILFREILPNVLPAMAYITLLGIAIAIVAEGGLALLGAGVDPPTATWGNMIDAGRQDMDEAPFIMFIPIGAMFITVMALNYLGDVVRTHFDVRESAL
ncbi:MAG: ABC transporter permease [Acidimicrobiales bacterium]|nr:ABC transporter permease [Actinomycetota bacterium]